MRSIGIGLLGCGTVGTGVVRLLTEQGARLRGRLGAELTLRRIVVRDPAKARDRAVDRQLLSTDPAAVIQDPAVEIVVELIGGVEPALQYVLQALGAGKHVVTANKALLSSHGRELFAAAERAGRALGFEASVGGGIPVLRGLRQGLAANRFREILAIINGTANFILTRMTDEGRPFDEVLAEAQRLGYAEADPSLDVDGIDAAQKLAILLLLGYGVEARPKDLHTEGIRQITPLDIQFAREFGYRIKLLAIAKDRDGELEARVHPTMLPEGHLLARVDDVFNAIAVDGDAVGPTLFYGRGAGMMPTASAVVSDLLEIGREVLAGTAGRSPVVAWPAAPPPVQSVEELMTHYYLRFQAVDRPGVFAQIAGILGRHEISISSVIQKGRRSEGGVPVVLLTHWARERNIRQALKAIDALPAVLDRTMVLRIEDEALE
ncbi:MAG: homoserine dehydrogenase [Deltaproteobacteria bacterium]|nr:homoserine dehydrogenase [Deltaproteobacteria bacterium]